MPEEEEEPDDPPPVEELPLDPDVDPELPPLAEDEPELDPLEPPLLSVDAVLECSGAGAPIVKLQAGVAMSITPTRLIPHTFPNLMPNASSEHHTSVYSECPN